MGQTKKEVMSGRLRKFQGKLAITKKSKEYLKRELPRLIDKESRLREKIRKEKKAIALVNRAKKLR